MSQFREGIARTGRSDSELKALFLQGFQGLDNTRKGFWFNLLQILIENPSVCLCEARYQLFLNIREQRPDTPGQWQTYG